MTDKPLIPLTDWQKQQSEMYSGLLLNNNGPILNGIECPTCGSELMDSTPLHVLACIPPKLNVHCSSEKCDYIGYRYK